MKYNKYNITIKEIDIDSEREFKNIQFKRRFVDVYWNIKPL